MEQNELEFRNNVRLSFQKAKEHINKLENEIYTLRLEVNTLKEEIRRLLPENRGLSQISTSSSSGNEGVWTDRQTDRQTVRQTDRHIPGHINISNFKSELEDFFLNKLTRQEFLIFLTIYQLEEQGPVTYKNLSNILQLSPSCIRTHVINIIHKGASLTKTKIKNKITILSIKPEFRDLNLKEKLTDLFYHIDSEQKRLI
jgi:hypothetical protein